MRRILGTMAALAFAGAVASKAFAQDDKKAEEIYLKHCKMCHAADGSGKKEDGSWLPVAKTLKLDKPELLSLLTEEAKKNYTDESCKKAVLEGKGKMKAMKEKLGEDEAKASCDHTKKLQASAK